MIDSHIHIDLCSSQDIMGMVISGVDTAITCSYEPKAIKSNQDMLKHFNNLLTVETLRAKENLMKLYVSLGIHPVTVNQNQDPVLDELINLIENDVVVAIGEIGLEKGSQLEVELFKKQLKIANNLDKKVIIHTPRKNKKEILKKELEIINETISPELVLIDHINFETIDLIIDMDFMIGLTVQPQKLSPKDILTITNDYGFDKFVLNSDISDKESNHLSLPITVHELKKRNVSNKKINKIVFKNSKDFFKLNIKKKFCF